MERDGCYLSDLHALIGTIGVAIPHLRPGTCLPRGWSSGVSAPEQP